MSLEQQDRCNFDDEIEETWVVITSINPLRQRYLDYLNLEWNVVIVADMKTPVDSLQELKSDNFHVLTIEMQDKYFPVLSRLIPYNSYSRKNLGYLYAAMRGATKIWDTDDDTFIRSQFLQESFLSNFTDICLVKGSNVFNPYEFFALNARLWPRGYPLNLVLKNEKSYESIQSNLDISYLEKIDVIQTLVNLCPDVDAIYRLTVSNSEFNFNGTRELLLIEPPLVAPGNTQSTLWMKNSSFLWTYIPSTLTFRFCDIFRSYVLQSNCKVAYAGFVSEQFRNPHNLMEDFASEIECYLSVEELIELIRQNSRKSLYEVYHSLSQRGLISSDELQIVAEYQLAFQKLIQ